MTRSKIGLLILLLVVSTGAAPAPAKQDPYASARQRLMHEIRSHVAQTSRRIGKDRLDPRVMQVMATVPRHEFVPAAVRRYAYENRPLPIGYGQTISQPYIVALMTDLLRPKSGDVVLEVGTGSAYQAAVLAHLVGKVYTIEIIPELGAQASKRLNQLGYRNVATKVADGYYGWPEHGPYDSIIVTAAATQIPPPLVKQLKPGGRMVIPVGSRFATQHLMLVEKSKDGKVRTRQLLPVMFVPLTGKR